MLHHQTFQRLRLRGRWRKTRMPRQALISLMLLLGAGSLAGCGASLDNLSPSGVIAGEAGAEVSSEAASNSAAVHYVKADDAVAGHSPSTSIADKTDTRAAPKTDTKDPSGAVSTAPAEWSTKASDTIAENTPSTNVAYKTSSGAPSDVGYTRGTMRFAMAGDTIAGTTLSPNVADKKRTDTPSSVLSTRGATRHARSGGTVAASTNTAYKIGAQDVLDIEVFKVPELSKTVQVAGTGTVNLPLLGEVPAAGITRRDFERRLTAMLGEKYLQNPQVTVSVKEYNSQKITVEGAVKKPGVYALQGSMSLLQVIAMAQGLAKNSDATVVLIRNGKRAADRFDIHAIRSGQAEDPVLQSGDMVLAGTSAIKEAMETFKGLPLGLLLSALL